MFEPLATAGLTALGAKSERAAARIASWAPEGSGGTVAEGVEEVVERIENPALAVSGSAENVVPMVSDVDKPAEGH